MRKREEKGMRGVLAANGGEAAVRIIRAPAGLGKVQKYELRHPIEAELKGTT